MKLNNVVQQLNKHSTKIDRKPDSHQNSALVMLAKMTESITNLKTEFHMILNRASNKFQGNLNQLGKAVLQTQPGLEIL
eukprot:398906-Ditylum_brightwellii.AAC.1